VRQLCMDPAAVTEDRTESGTRTRLEFRARWSERSIWPFVDTSTKRTSPRGGPPLLRSGGHQLFGTSDGLWFPGPFDRHQTDRPSRLTSPTSTVRLIVRSRSDSALRPSGRATGGFAVGPARRKTSRSSRSPVGGDRRVWPPAGGLACWCGKQSARRSLLVRPPETKQKMCSSSYPS